MRTSPVLMRTTCSGLGEDVVRAGALLLRGLAGLLAWLDLLAEFAVFLVGGADQDDAAVGAGDGAADQEQVVVGVDLDDGEIADGGARAAVASRGFVAL